MPVTLKSAPGHARNRQASRELPSSRFLRTHIGQSELDAAPERRSRLSPSISEGGAVGGCLDRPGRPAAVGTLGPSNRVGIASHRGQADDAGR
jgi:hypothetical protein